MDDRCGDRRSLSREWCQGGVTMPLACRRRGETYLKPDPFALLPLLQNHITSSPSPKHLTRQWASRKLSCNPCGILPGMHQNDSSSEVLNFSLEVLHSA
jgi:hypothetical protein